MRTQHIWLVFLISACASKHKDRNDKVDGPEVGPNVEGAYYLTFESKESLGLHFSIESLQSQLCPETDAMCILQQFEPELFILQGSSYAPTKKLETEYRQGIGLLNGRALAVESLTVRADIEKSLIYGWAGSIDIAKLNSACESRPVGPGDLFNIKSSDGSHRSGRELITPREMFVATDLRFKQSDPSILTKAGSSVEVQSTVVGMAGIIDADYQDSKEVIGSYTISVADGSDYTLAANQLNRSLLRLTPPKGFPVPTKGYGGNPEAFDPMDPVCRNPEPVGEVCEKWSAQEWCFSGVLEACTNGNTWEGKQYCYNLAFPAISNFFSRTVSPRVFDSQGKIDCFTLLPTEAKTLSLPTSWSANSDSVQFFVKNSDYLTCQQNCNDKVARSSALDYRFSDIEPAYNYCIDRWAKRDWSSYAKSQTELCRATPQYILATQQSMIKKSVASFLSKCRSIGDCNRFLEAVKLLNNLPNNEELESRFNALNQDMAIARKARLPMIIEAGNETILSADALNKSTKMIADTEATFIAELKKSSISIPFDKLWESIMSQLFSSARGEMASTIGDFDKLIGSTNRLIQKIEMLKTISADQLECSFSAVGDFRHYKLFSMRDFKYNQTNNKVIFSSKLIKDFEKRM